MLCQLNQNNQGFWQCPGCDWVCKRESVNPPHRKCTKPPDLNTPEHRAAIKAKILTQLEPLAMTNDLTTIAEQLDRCLVCERFNGRTCTARGSSCRMRDRWLEFLALMTRPCEKFATKASVD